MPAPDLTEPSKREDTKVRSSGRNADLGIPDVDATVGTLGRVCDRPKLACSHAVAALGWGGGCFAIVRETIRSLGGSRSSRRRLTSSSTRSRQPRHGGRDG